MDAVVCLQSHGLELISISWFLPCFSAATMSDLWVCCCVSVQVCILQRSIWRPITSQHLTKAVPVWRLLQMLLLFPVSGGRTATILCGLKYPKILCVPEKEEKKKENGDIAWRGDVTFSCLGGRNRALRVKHLVTQPGNAPKTRPSHLTTADAVNKVSLKDSALEASFRGCTSWIVTLENTCSSWS